MIQEFFDFRIDTNGQKLYEFTNQIIDWIRKNNFKNGVFFYIGVSESTLLDAFDFQPASISH